MAQYWSEYPLSETEDRVPDILPAGNYVSVILNGHGALTAWVAGPRRCFRTPYPASAHPPVKVTLGDPSKPPERTWYEPFTEDDLRAADDDVNSYLAEADVRLQPRGYKWHVLVPANIHSGEDLERALREKNTFIEPKEVLLAITDLYAALITRMTPR